MPFFLADPVGGREATLDERQRALRDVSLAKQIGEHLQRQYPGHFFKVAVDSNGGIVKIAHPLLPKNWCHVVWLARLNSDPSMKCITRAGGELLERFYQPRHRRNPDIWREAAEGKYRKLKHSIMTQVNWATGERKFILPEELSR